MEFDFKRESLCKSLAETITWCMRQELTATVEESEDIMRRRVLGQQGGELTRRAYMESGRFWNRIFRRNYTATRLWRRGTELFHEADLGAIAPLQDQLRTPSLRPSMSLAEVRVEHDREETVRAVVVRRSEFIHDQEPSSSLKAGRLLLYSPEENLFDGAAKYDSKGFFDVDNAPPWDTWVAFSHGTLLSWVPPQLTGLAQSGIDANPEGCIRWLQSNPVSVG